MKAHNIIKKGISLEKTINLKKVIRKNVLSKGGKVIGKVSEIRINPKNMKLEGVLTRRIFKKPLYIDKEYFSSLSHEAIILNIEPSLLMKGKKVIAPNGKSIGKVIQVLRKDKSNEFQDLQVRSLFSRKFSIKPSEIKSSGKLIILKSNNNAKKKYFWQRPQ